MDTQTILAIAGLIVGIAAAGQGLLYWTRVFRRWRITGKRLLEFLRELWKNETVPTVLASSVLALVGVPLLIISSILLFAGGSGDEQDARQGTTAGTSGTPTTDLIETAFSSTQTDRPGIDSEAPEEGTIGGDWSFSGERFDPDKYQVTSGSFGFTLEERREGTETYRWQRYRAAINLAGKEEIGSGTAVLHGRTIQMEGIDVLGRFEAELELLEDNNVMTGTIDYQEEGTLLDGDVTFFRRG